jgi:hypothetical protein
MIEADARRSEWLAGKFGRWATERGAAVNAIMEAVIVDHRREPKPRQQLAIDIARALEKGAKE